MIDHRYLDLGYAFRKSKVWKQLSEEELFAIRIPSNDGQGEIGYCCVMGSLGEHMALSVYVGAEGFTTYRKVVDPGPDFVYGNMDDMLSQDCIQCSIEQRDQFAPDELDMLREYCSAAGIPFRAPYPDFQRFRPHCLPWYIVEDDDWTFLETALRVAIRLSEEIKAHGKSSLGLRPVVVGRHDQCYGAEQMGLFDSLSGDRVTIPLYSIVDGKLKQERIPLPPYAEPVPATPTRFNDIAMAKLMKHRQRGVYECDILRLPHPIEGDPPFLPAMLMSVDEDGLVNVSHLSNVPSYDADAMLDHFIESLEDRYPKEIRVRSNEAKCLFEEFCRRANIRLTVTDDLDRLDEAADDMREHLDNAEPEDTFAEMAEALDEMSPDEIRALPDVLLDTMIAHADLLPARIAKKLKKAVRS